MSAKSQVNIRLDAETESLWDRLTRANPNLTQLELMRLALGAAERDADTVSHPELGELQAMWSRIAAVVTGLAARDVERQTNAEGERKLLAAKFAAVQSERDALKEAVAEVEATQLKMKAAFDKADAEREQHLQRLQVLDAKILILEPKAGDADALRGQVESLKTQVESLKKSEARLAECEKLLAFERQALQQTTALHAEAREALAVKTVEAAEREKRIQSDQERYQKLESDYRAMAHGLAGRVSGASRTEESSNESTSSKKDKR